MREARQVDHRLGPVLGEELSEAPRVGDLDLVGVHPRQLGAGACIGPGHLVPAREERAGQASADEAGDAGDEEPHEPAAAAR